MKIKKALENLNEICESHKADYIIFEFNHNNINGSLVYFSNTNTFMLGIRDLNAGWLIPVINNDSIQAFIPLDQFKLIKHELDDGEEVITENGSYFKKTPTPMFETIKTTMECLKSSEARVPSKNEIIDGIGRTRTVDKNYDPEGEKPYFKSWRKNGVRNTGTQIEVSTKNLIKTSRSFGQEIKDYCKENNITSVWSKEPTTNSRLIFSSTNNIKSNIDS
jgi:hypothetical protein